MFDEQQVDLVVYQFTQCVLEAHFLVGVPNIGLRHSLLA